MHDEGKSVSCQLNLGQIEPKVSNYLSNDQSHILQA